jgi:hypothetical protein
MEKFLQDLLYAVIVAGLPVIIAYGSVYLKTLRDKAINQIDNKYAKDTIKEVSDTIIAVVNQVSQTYVSDLKHEGKFTVESQKIALQKALELIKQMLTEDEKKLIEEKYKDLDTYVTTIIESYIHTTK